MDLNGAYRYTQRMRNALFTRGVRRGFRSFGTGSSLGLPIDLIGQRDIAIGSGVIFYPGCILQSHLGGLIEIGDRTQIYERAVITAQSSVIIEGGVGIGRGCHISDHSHDYSDPALDFVDKPGSVPAPVLIRQGAWIADGVIVMPGVTIGRRAVVGARSVVTRDVPDFGVVAGVPARPIANYGEARLRTL